MNLKISLLLLFAFITSTAFAQLYCPPTFGKRTEGKYHVALGAGPTLLYGDLGNPNTTGFAFYVAGDYTLTRGIDVGLEGQLGSLKANEDVGDRYVINNYQGLGLMVKVFPFKLFNEKQYRPKSFLNNMKESFYVGAGILGIVNNFNPNNIHRNANVESTEYDTPNETWGPIKRNDDDTPYVFNDEQQFKDRINSITLPTLNVGFAVPVNQLTSSSGRFWSVMLNGQFNFSNNDLLDGYMPYQSGTGNRVGLKNDFYSFYTLGIRYSL